MNKQQILLSGIQPSSKLTLGNYLGAIKSFLNVVDHYQSFIFVADYHAITLPFAPQELKKNSFAIVKLLLACGLNPNKTTIFLQSDLFEHLGLAYLLMVHTTLGELERMTQFKVKSQSLKLANQTNTIPSGLLFYPLLMAADILAYDSNLVPIGQDQKQHLELTRTLAKRINKKYGKKLFQIPQSLINLVGAKIMDLQDPKVKMSKSSLIHSGTIFLDEPIESATTKLIKAKTDSLNQINYDPINQPGVSNLIQIYCALTEQSIDQYVMKMAGKNYANLKADVIDQVCALLSKIKGKLKEITDDQVATILANNAKKCRIIAQKKLMLIQQAMGLGRGN